MTDVSVLLAAPPATAGPAAAAAPLADAAHALAAAPAAAVHGPASAALAQLAAHAPATQSIGWLAIAPPLTVAATALAALAADLFPRTRRATGPLAVLGLLVALAFLIPLRGGDRTAFCLAGRPQDCSYAADRFALVMQLLVLGGALVAALLSLHLARGTAGGPARGDGARGSAHDRTAHARPGTPDERRGTPQGRSGTPDGRPGGLPRGEFWFLLLGSAAGAALLPAARDLATLLVALETTSLPAYALVGLRRDLRGGEAALKFFLGSVTATAVTLLGIAFVYAASGSLYVTEVAHGLAHAPGQLRTLAGLGAVLTLAGFAFKTAAAPFHLWVPDTYLGAPLPVAAYLSVVGKAAGLAGIAVLTVLALPRYAHLWGPVLAVLAALTMTAGNLATLRSFHRAAATRPGPRPDDPGAPPDGRPGTAGPANRGSAVRLLAYSSVAQAGYLLVPLAAAGYTGRPSRAVGAMAAFALIYAVLNLGAFTAVAAAARDRGRGGLRLADHRGLFARRPATALALAFFVLSLAGLPPGVAGLFGKVVVFRAAVDAGLGWLALVMAGNVVLGLFAYALWTIGLFTPTGDGGPARERATRLPAGIVTALVLTAALAVLLSVLPQLALRVAQGSLLG